MPRLGTKPRLEENDVTIARAVLRIVTDIKVITTIVVTLLGGAVAWGTSNEPPQQQQTPTIAPIEQVRLDLGKMEQKLDGFMYRHAIQDSILREDVRELREAVEQLKQR